MGHTRLGRIPKSQKWAAVVAELSRLEGGVLPGAKQFSESVGAIALRTLQAAETGLNKATNDQGLRYAFYILSRLALSSREENWPRALQTIGIKLSERSSVFDLTMEVHAAIDRHISASSRPSDVSEIAQQAAGEAITALATSKAVTLFGSGRDELKQAIRSLSTKKGFSVLGQIFFGRFMARFLNFYLSRVTTAQITSGNFYQVGEISSFNEALRTHCEQSARVVHDFCGEWFSKTEFQEGINLENASRFVAVAVNKLRSELEQQRAES